MTLAKVQEIEEKVQDLQFRIKDLMSHLVDLNKIQEATLFDQVEATSSSSEEKPKTHTITRRRITDGTMTAKMISFRMTKETGRQITPDMVVKVGKQIKANPSYSARQHVSRYSPESVKTIMNLFRSFSRL